MSSLWRVLHWGPLTALTIINWISLGKYTILQGTPGNVADVSATELPFTYRISTLSFTLQDCCSRMQKINPFRNMTTELYRERQLWSGNESVEIRYVNGSFVAETSATLPGVPRHVHTYFVSDLCKLMMGGFKKRTYHCIPSSMYIYGNNIG